MSMGDSWDSMQVLLNIRETLARTSSHSRIVGHLPRQILEGVVQTSSGSSGFFNGKPLQKI